MGKKKNKKSAARKTAAKIRATSDGSGPVSRSNTTKQLNETFGDTPLPDIPPDNILAHYDTDKWKKDAKELTESWKDLGDFTMGTVNTEQPVQFEFSGSLDPKPSGPAHSSAVAPGASGVHPFKQQESDYCKQKPYLDDENHHAVPDNDTAGEVQDSDEPLMNTRAPSSAPYEHIGPLPAGPSAPIGSLNTVSTAADLIRQMFHRAIASDVCAGNIEGGSDRERELLELCEGCIANGWTVEELKARMLQNVPEEFREEMEGFVGMLLQLGPVDADDFGLGKNSRKRE